MNRKEKGFLKSAFLFLSLTNFFFFFRFTIHDSPFTDFRRTKFFLGGFMTRFEEVQMKIAESAKNYLEIFNMQVFIEQFTLDRESRFSLALPNMETPYVLTATVSFTYDAFQTGMTLYEEDTEESSMDADNPLELEFLIKLPIMEDYPNIEALLAEVEEEYPDTQPVLFAKEIIPSEQSSREYEISYIYDIEANDLGDDELFDQLFEELRGILELVLKRTKDYIDHSWYSPEE